MHRLWFPLLAAMATCLLMTAVYAHQPRMVEGNTVQVERPEVSQAFYAELHGRPQTYHIRARITFDLYVQLTVPEMPNAPTDFIVDIWRDGRRLQQLVGAKAQWSTFYERFGGDTYRRGPEYRRAAAPPGRYTVRVSSADNEGKYVLAIGEREAFTLGDWLHTLAVLPKVKAFMGKSPLTAYFNLFGLFMLILLAVVLTPLLLLIHWWRRKTRRR